MKNEELEKYLRNTLLNTRGDLKITQEQMAEQLNITPRAMSNLECGKNTMGLESFLRFYLKFMLDEKDKSAFWQIISNIIDESA